MSKQIFGEFWLILGPLLEGKIRPKSELEAILGARMVPKLSQVQVKRCPRRNCNRQTNNQVQKSILNIIYFGTGFWQISGPISAHTQATLAVKTDVCDWNGGAEHPDGLNGAGRRCPDAGCKIFVMFLVPVQK